MGTFMYSFYEVKISGKWVRPENHKIFGFDHKREPFDNGYDCFAFLAGVRNRSHCTPISTPKGLPTDSEYLNRIDDFIIKYDNHSHSWLTLAELLAFDYEQTFVDKFLNGEPDPSAKNFPDEIRGKDGLLVTNKDKLSESFPDESLLKTVTYREFLGDYFFNDLALLQTFGPPDDVRIIFWFD